MRNITITGQWVDSIADADERGEVMRLIFSLASQNEYDIRVAGQRWGNSAQNRHKVFTRTPVNTERGY